MNTVNLQNKVIIRSIVNVNYTPADWGLYTEEFPRAELDRVATYMNKRYNHAYNTNMTTHETIAYMQPMLAMFSKYGAADSAVKEVLYNLIERTYHVA